MGLSNTLKVQRAKLDMNQSELSKLVGVSRQTISLIERGGYNPSITLVLKLTKVLGVRTEELFQYYSEPHCQDHRMTKLRWINESGD